MIDRLVQLHEEIRIIYLVDCYEASLNLTDGQVKGTSARGATVQEALDNLTELLANVENVVEYRKIHFGHVPQMLGRGKRT